jgi:hypothetical protein
MGGDKRFRKVSTAADTPGAIYDPCFRLDRPGLPKYSFGKAPPIHKKGRDGPKTGTPINLGPNAYFKEGYPEELVKKSDPHFSVPKAIRGAEWLRKQQPHETYEE